MSSSQELKEKILNYSRERFFKEGFAKISIDELTSELSMSKKTFYQTFESKDDLIEEIVARTLNEINTVMDRILVTEKNSVQKLQDLLLYLSTLLSSMSKSMMADMQKHQPQLWQRIERFRRERLTKNMTLVLEQGTKEGFIRKDVNPRIFLLAFLSGVEGIIQPSVLMNESFSANEALHALTDVFFNGIVTDSGRAQLHGRRYRHRQSEKQPFIHLPLLP